MPIISDGVRNLMFFFSKNDIRRVKSLTSFEFMIGKVGNTKEFI